MPQNVASDQGLHCLPFNHEYFKFSHQIVYYSCPNIVRSLNIKGNYGKFWLGLWKFYFNPCHAEKMPCPLLILSQSNYLILNFDTIHILNDKQCRSRSVGFRSHLIWIYTVCKDRAYLGSAGLGLMQNKKNIINLSSAEFAHKMINVKVD